MLYNKAHLERDLSEIELASQQISVAVADGRINGLRALELQTLLDALTRKLPMRVQASRRLVQDIQEAKRDLERANRGGWPDGIRLAKARLSKLLFIASLSKVDDLGPPPTPAHEPSCCELWEQDHFRRMRHEPDYVKAYFRLKDLGVQPEAAHAEILGGAA